MLMLGAPNLAGKSGIAFGFFGRTGGVSIGIYESLNCGPGSSDERGLSSKIAVARLRHSQTGTPGLSRFIKSTAPKR